MKKKSHKYYKALFKELKTNIMYQKQIIEFINAYFIELKFINFYKKKKKNSKSIIKNKIIFKNFIFFTIYS